jgi:SAM-dependent methyltransferase
MSTPITYRDHLLDRYRLLYDWIPADATRLLDIGCGNAYFTQWFRARARVVVGTDHNARQLAGAHDVWPDLGMTAAAGERLPFADNTFDVVVMSDVLEHMADDQTALNEALRVLTPDGHLLISLPNRGLFGFLDGDNVVNRLVWFLSKLRLPKGRHPDGRRRTRYEGFCFVRHRHYRRGDLVRLLGSAGRIERIRYGGVLLWPLCYLAEKLAEVFFHRPIVTSRHRFLRRLRALDFRVSLGPLSYNLIADVQKTP